MKDRQDKAGLWTREEANAALYGRHHMMQNGNGRNEILQRQRPQQTKRKKTKAATTTHTSHDHT